MIERPSVLIVGGGLAGLACATALAPLGLRVTILEARNRLGGRASSFTDPRSGELIDTCQHVSMGCCTNFAHFCRTVGIDSFLRRQPCLYFMTADRRVSRFAADRLPAPLHLARSLWRAHFLGLGDKLRIAWGLASLLRAGEAGDLPFADWLARHAQTRRTIDRFWSVVLTSALNESTERVGLRYARKVFLDGFLRHREGFDIELPSVPLGRLYGAELQDWLAGHDVRVCLGQAARSIGFGGGRVRGVETRAGQLVSADWYVAAAPFERLLNLLPEDIAQAHPAFAGLWELETSPITSVHLWYRTPIMDRPHIVVVDGTSQWIFNRGQTATGEHYVQVVISAARQFEEMSGDDVRLKVAEELTRLFPTAGPENLVRARVITEHSATFSAGPGVDRLRPDQASPVENLFLAGDWTATGWPATMEGAVRSGYLAAEKLMTKLGRPARFIRPDL